eukprot:1918227-Rhodomonas_salina.1
MMKFVAVAVLVAGMLALAEVIVAPQTDEGMKHQGFSVSSLSHLKQRSPLGVTSTGGMGKGIEASERAREETERVRGTEEVKRRSEKKGFRRFFLTIFAISSC